MLDNKLEEYYAPHFFNDGHSYHEECQTGGCYNLTVHTHGKHHYYPKAIPLGDISNGA